MEHCYYAYYLENSKNVRIDLNIDFANKLEMSEFAKNIFEDYEKEENIPVFSAKHNRQYLLNYLNLLGDLVVTENPFEEWKEHLFKAVGKYSIKYFNSQVNYAKELCIEYLKYNDFSQDFLERFVNSKGITVNRVRLEFDGKQIILPKLQETNNKTIYRYESKDFVDIVFSSVHYALSNGMKLSKCEHCGKWFFKDGGRSGSRKKFCDRKSTFKGYEHLSCEQAVRNIKQQCGRIKKRIETKAYNANKENIFNHAYSKYVYEFQKQCDQYTYKSQKSNSVENLNAYMCFLISLEKRKEWQNNGEHTGKTE